MSAVSNTGGNLRLGLTKTFLLRLLVLGLLFFMALLSFVYKHYNTTNASIKQLKLLTTATAEQLLVYPYSEKGIEPDFASPVFPQQNGDTLVFQLNNCRQFRLYFNTSGTFTFKNAGLLLYTDGAETPAFKVFERSPFYKPKSAIFPLTVNVAGNSYLQVEKVGISKSEFYVIACMACLGAFAGAWLLLFLFGDFFENFNFFTRLQVAAACIFCLAIFLPLPAANIALMASFLLVLKDFKIPEKKTILYVALPLVYFVWMVVVTLMRSGAYYSPLLETSLPFFFLPFYFLCTSKFSFVNAFLPVVLLLTMFFGMAACFDFALFHNTQRFSFDAFTIYFHPVYYAYAVVFAIVLMVSQTGTYKKTQMVFGLGILFAGLVFAGSKLMLGFVMVFLLLVFFRRNKILALGALALCIGTVLVFAPLRKRFMEVSNLSHLSVLQDSTITANDERINGLSIRVIIWQECLSELNTASDWLLGKGAAKEVDVILHNRLVKRGLKAGTTWYDPHNQYIATLYRFGLAGIALLLFMVVWTLRLAVINKNQLLLWSLLLLLFAMCTESILQRAAGVYLFICILLPQSIVLISNTANSLENRDFRHPGNPQ